MRTFHCKFMSIVDKYSWFIINIVVYGTILVFYILTADALDPVPIVVVVVLSSMLHQ